MAEAVTALAVVQLLGGEYFSLVEGSGRVNGRQWG